MAIRTRTFAPARSRFTPLRGDAFSRRLHWIYLAFGLAFLAFVGVMALLERLGMPRNWIGFLFLVGPIVFYAGIGILCRTTDPAEYYVAGRRVPALYNGMATGADWMSAASFIGMAGRRHDAHRCPRPILPPFPSPSAPPAPATGAAPDTSPPGCCWPGS